MKAKLGDWKRVDIRTLWPKESSDFTPWLAEEDNLAKLGDELGLELELEGMEVSVGPYSADILARDTSTDSFVVVENQYNKTNHDHLGKLITYASVLDATAVIWIAEDFTDEHKKALDWLNDHSSEDLAYYGVSMEVWKIDDSSPAIRFNVVSRPAAVKRQTAIKTSIENITPTKKTQLEFWTKFREVLLENKIVSTAHTPKPKHWYNITIGRSKIHISNTLHVNEGKMCIRLYMHHSVAEQVLDLLVEEKESIEKEIGTKLDWNPKPDRMNKLIRITRIVDLQDRNKWDEYVSWMVEMSSKFISAFKPRIKNIIFTPSLEENEEE